MLASTLLTVNFACAEPFEVTEIPTYLDNQLGVGTFIGGLIASLFVLGIVMIPLIYLTKGKAYSLYIIFSMAILAPLVGLGWFPVYVYVIILLLLAFGFSEKLRDLLGSVGR